jgi:hypothetical protein
MRNNFFCVFIFLIFGVTAFAQPKVNSPYSRLGLGDFFDQNFIAISTLGGIASAYTDPYHVNIKNPASIAHLRTTSFDIGLNARYTQLKDDQFKNSVWQGNIGYLSLGFPLFNPINEILERKVRSVYWGMNMSLMPYTDVGYDINNVENFEPVGEIERKYVGTGGTYKFIWGNGVKYKNLSFGLNLGYLFGQLSFDREVNFTETQAYRDELSDKVGIKGFVWNIGFLYDLYLDKEVLDDGRTPQKRITFGFYGNSKSNFNTKSNSLYQRIFNFDNIRIADTITSNTDLIGSGVLPGELSLGINYRDGLKWRAGISISTQWWSKYENSAKKEFLQDSWRLSLGVGYRPDINAFESFYKTVDYRGGIFFGTDPRSVDQTQLKHYGVTLGVGIPFFVQRKISFLNLGVEIGRLGVKESINNTYAKFSFGFTLNDDEWFLKRKFN